MAGLVLIKNDLKIQTIDGKTGDLIDVDTSKLSAEEIVKLLKAGDTVIESFGETYLNDVIDGEDDFSFDFEID
jgi:hypothetical protein